MQLLKTISTLMIFCALSCSSKTASTNIESVYSKGGNIYCKYEDNNVKQITYTGIDTLAVISPDKKLIAFVRQNPGIYDENNEIMLTDNSEIWLYDLTNNKNTCIILPVNDEAGVEPENILKNFDNLVFSNDGQKLLFISSAWATSGAIHEYSIPSKIQRYLISGNSLYIIPNGKYKDYLVVNKHKYYQAGGSYDYFWLLDMEGKEIREIGESEANVQSFLNEYN